MHKNKKHKQEGGLLVGPSHEEGGIGAVVSGGEEVELEGGEYIINAQTVDALGTQFLDKINSTQTTYHTGGFGPNQLPSPSKYSNGGQIRRNNMRRRRKFAHGGYHDNNVMGNTPYQTNQYNNPYRKGGRVRRKFEHGGHTHLPNLMQTEHTTAGGTHHTHLINFQNQGQGNHNHSSHIQGRRMEHGGMHNSCPPGQHMMPDGTCMMGNTHPTGGYRKGGGVRRKPIRKRRRR